MSSTGVRFAHRSESLLHAAQLQIRVIRALMVREMYTRYGRHNIGFLWVIGEPLLFCVAVSIMWYLVRGSSEHSVSVIAFVITGYSPLTLWRHCVSRSVKAFQANSTLMFHRQVTPLDIIIARLMLEFIGSTAGFMLAAGGAVLAGIIDPPHDVGLIYAGWLYVAAFSAGCGLVMAALTEMSDLLEHTVQVITYVSIPLSGAFTMVDWVPHKMQWVLLLSPSVNAFEMIRGGWFGPTVHAKYNLVFLTASCVLLLLTGLMVVRRVRRYISIA
jgi:capsular polysaccharide transport system permease protein